MRTRTRLTTPPDQAPTDDDRSAGGERYVPAPGLPHEPRIPGPHRRMKIVLTAVATTLAVLAILVLLGEESQLEDPSVPDRPGQDEPPRQLELPET